MNEVSDEDLQEANESRSSSLTEVLALLYVTIILLALFLKILFG